MKNKRIVFMGTPIFACAILQRLLDEGCKVVGVVSQPDKKVGRKQVITYPPVKELALKYDLPVIQPIKIKSDYEAIIALQPDLIITCAYGQLVPDELLNAPSFGSINVHASILPKLRGGAPIHKAIIYGESESGVSIMRMVKKMDAGAVCGLVRVPIAENDTMGDLHDKLAVAGADELMRQLPAIFNHVAIFVEQDESKVSYAWNISKEEEKIDLSQEIQIVYNQIRGFIPYPIGYAMHLGKKIKIHKAHIIKTNHDSPIGSIIGFVDGCMQVALQGGYLMIEELQLEGKSKTSAKDFYNGQGKTMIGQVLD